MAVAHLAYTFGFNGLHPKHAWMANRIDPDAIIARAERARREGADLVVVSLHWGQELSHAVSPDQDRIARRLSSSDAIDLIVGHHAHVVQPIRRSAGRWVAFGAGNSLTGMTADGLVPDVQDGMVVLVTFAPTADAWEVSKIRFAPTWVQPGPFIVRLVGPALDRGVVARRPDGGSPPIVGANRGYGGRARDRRQAVPRGAPLAGRPAREI